jgi:peroxiredoxin
MKNFKLIIIIIIFSVIIGFALIYFVGLKFIGNQPPQQNTALLEPQDFGEVAKKEGEKLDYPAPDFALPDLAGKEQKLSANKGKATVLSFWTTWNPLAQDQFVILDLYYKSIKDSRNVALWAVNSQEDKSVILNFIRRGSYDLPVLLDEKGMVGELYKISILPITYFIGKDGRVKEIYIGILTAEDLKDKVQKLSSEQD